MPADADSVRVVRSIPGRARVHLAGWTGANPEALADRVRRVAGVASVAAHGRTCNVLVRFDPGALSEQDVLLALAEAVADLGAGEHAHAESQSRQPRVGPAEAAPQPGPRSVGRRARGALHGLDRAPELAARAVERLEGLPEVTRAVASPLTGRVLVELVDDEASLDDVLDTIGELEEAFAGPEPEFPAHPLDRGQVIEGGARLIGASVGLALLAARRVAGASGPPTARSGPGEAVALLSLSEGFPPVARRVEQALGHERKELLFGAVSIVGLTFSGGTLGLLLAGASGLRLLTEAQARRTAFRDYAGRAEDASDTLPGAHVRLLAGERVSLPATVVAGFGTAPGADGTPGALRPGAPVAAGARLQGGPFELRLQAPPGFEPVARPVPLRRNAVDRYVTSTVRAALLIAVVTGINTRSASRVLSALLLMNPRAALVGQNAADLSASARALRCGATIVGTREDRTLRRPDALVLAGARTLIDGLELSGVAPLDDALDDDEVLRLAGLVNAAAGSPWANALRPRGGVVATEGTFDGAVAGAEIDGVRWTLEPLRHSPPAALAARAVAGDHLLVLRRQPERRALAVLALRARLAEGAVRLLAVARRLGARLETAAAQDTPAAPDRARRTALPFHATGAGGLADHIRRWQRQGEIV